MINPKVKTKVLEKVLEELELQKSPFKTYSSDEIQKEVDRQLQLELEKKLESDNLNKTQLKSNDTQLDTERKEYFNAEKKKKEQLDMMLRCAENKSHVSYFPCEPTIYLHSDEEFYNLDGQYQALKTSIGMETNKIIYYLMNKVNDTIYQMCKENSEFKMMPVVGSMEYRDNYFDISSLYNESTGLVEIMIMFMLMKMKFAVKLQEFWKDEYDLKADIMLHMNLNGIYQLGKKKLEGKEVTEDEIVEQMEIAQKEANSFLDGVTITAYPDVQF